MTTVRVSWTRDIPPVDHDGQTADLEFATQPLASSGSLLVPKSERYLVIPVRMLRLAGTDRVRLCGRVPWPTYRSLFDCPHPNSKRVKTEYHRRVRSRDRRNR